MVYGRHRLCRAVRRRRRALAAGLAVAATALAATATQGRDARTGPSVGPAAEPDGHARAPGAPATARGASEAGRGEPDARRGPGEARRGGTVSAPVRIADAATVRLLRPGDRVDVIASPEDSGPARVLAREARVEALPESGQAPGKEGALIVLAVPRATATELAGATTDSLLAVTLC